MLTTPRAEGTPNLVLDWLAARTGYWQGVVVLNSQPADLTERLRNAADAYESHDLFDRGGLKFPLIAKTAYEAVMRYRPDVLVCWPTGFANWVCAGARVAGCRRLLVHAGNPAGLTLRGRLITMYVTWSLAAMRAKVVCCSEYVRDTYRVSSGIQTSVFYSVHNCTRAAVISDRVAVARASRQLNAPPVAVMVATLEPHKDHDTLLKAWQIVVREHPSALLWLVGHGSLRERLGRQVSELGIANAVEFLGTRSDVPELLAHADLFVFSTTSQEGLGSVLLEALAAELPVVSSDVPACRELLEGGKWGALVSPADPTALAFEICRSFTQPRPLDERSMAARYATGFTPSRMMAAYLKIAGCAPHVEVDSAR